MREVPEAVLHIATTCWHSRPICKRCRLCSAADCIEQSHSMQHQCRTSKAHLDFLASAGSCRWCLIIFEFFTRDSLTQICQALTGTPPTSRVDAGHARQSKNYIEIFQIFRWPLFVTLPHSS